MRISDIKGKKQLRIIGMLMALVDSVSDEPSFQDFKDALNGEDNTKALFKLGPILERDDVAEQIISIVACAKGITEEEADSCNMFAEFTELLTSDVELPAFLSEQQ